MHLLRDTRGKVGSGPRFRWPPGREGGREGREKGEKEDERREKRKESSFSNRKRCSCSILKNK